MSKRVRTDGDLSKDNYSPSKFGGVVVSKGPVPPSATSIPPHRRRKVKVSTSHQTKPLTLQYLRSMRGLNTSFLNHLLSFSSNSNYVEPCLDYLSYTSDLSARYQQGERTSLLTFGSGDCGQLAHGIEEDNDLMCKKPKTVMDLHTVSIVRVGAGGLHNVAITSSGDCYTWGCNDDGSVGREGVEHQPMIIGGVGKCENGDAGDCQSVVCGGGKVWMFGAYKDKEGKCFRDTRDPREVKSKVTEPWEIPGLKGAIEVKCGASFNAAIVEDGGCMSWGLGECGELGRIVGPMKDGEAYNLERIVREHITPHPVVFKGGGNRFVRKVGCGAYHLMVCTVENTGGGGLWASGLNNYGQLGLGDIDNRTELCRIDIDGERVEDVDGGMHHSMCYTKEGGLYAWGRGDSGQLGIKEECEVGYCEMEPMTVELPGAKGRVKSIGCGSNHNLVVTTANEVFSWGYGDMLALGHGKDRDENKPRIIKGIEGRVLVVAGGGQHSAIVVSK